MGGSNKQTSTSSSQPYKPAEPLLKQGMGDALDLYRKGSLVTPNTMSTVVPYAQQTTQGMGAIENMANSNMNGQGLSGQLQGIINNGGYNADQNTALEGIRNTATGAFDVNANPAFQQVLQRAQGDALNAVNQNAAGLGRYGSGTHDGVVAREVGDLTAQMVGDEYHNWQGRQDAAQSQLFNAGQQAQGNLSSAYDAAKAPITDLMGVGGMNEDLYGRALNDRLRIANEQAGAPLANILALNSVASGAGSFGNQTETAQGPSNTLSNIAGAGLGAMSMGNSASSKPKI